jgi:hypothetical protein
MVPGAAKFRHLVKNAMRHLNFGQLGQRLFAAIAAEECNDVCVMIETSSRSRYVIGHDQVRRLFLQFAPSVFGELLGFRGKAN